MRIARENKGVDAQIGIFLHARCDRRAVAHQRGAGAAAHQADAGPQVRADLQVILFAAVQRRHAPLADGVETRKGLLCIGDGFLIEVRDQPVGGAPGLFGGFPHDDMQADTEAYLAAFRRRFGAHLFDLLFNLRRRFSPGEIHFYLFGGQILRGGGRSAKIERRARLLHRREQQFGAFHLNMLAVEIDGFAFQHPAPDVGELG